MNLPGSHAYLQSDGLPSPNVHPETTFESSTSSLSTVLVIVYRVRIVLVVERGDRDRVEWHTETMGNCEGVVQYGRES